jgi:hypothetical protein
MHQNLITSKHGRPILDLSLNNPSLEKKKTPSIAFMLLKAIMHFI